MDKRLEYHTSTENGANRWQTVALLLVVDQQARLQLCTAEKKLQLHRDSFSIQIFSYFSALGICLQCFDAVGWAARKASGL